MKLGMAISIAVVRTPPLAATWPMLACVFFGFLATGACQLLAALLTNGCALSSAAAPEFQPPAALLWLLQLLLLPPLVAATNSAKAATEEPAPARLQPAAAAAEMCCAGGFEATKSRSSTASEISSNIFSRLLAGCRRLRRSMEQQRASHCHGTDDQTELLPLAHAGHQRNLPKTL
eukprot:TRINITY_DN41682_c0_g1_i1.p2 TRINITY_DN41682_c0_g1~~TRINITY_DN41682_c0_g1_i1.p2  ORF type:complete len:176 (-),score=35.27 TRINITY_DN41682_c0_g1_i1:9-536(-)